jgi:membrane complex biogenesis BtpA family protein
LGIDNVDKLVENPWIRFDNMKLKQSIIGMIHIPALPGTPKASLSPTQVLDKTLAEARIYQQAGIDALAIENMHDVPYLNRQVGPEITAMMTLLGKAVKQETNLPAGIQILAGANREALAAAHAAGLDFIRAEGFVFAHVADEGTMQSDAGELLRYRKQIGAEQIRIFTDIKKKHSAHALTADVDMVETAKAAEFFLSDGLIVTGAATGVTASLQELEAVKNAVDLPIMVGSGVNLDNVGDYLSLCDGLIIGSWFKQGGHWARDLDQERIARFMEKVHRLR